MNRIDKLSNINTNSIENRNKINSRDSSDKKVSRQDIDNISFSEDSSKMQLIAKQSNKLLDEIEGLEKQRIQEIRKKLESKFYQRDNIINSIATTILDEDDFQNLFMKEDMQEIMIDYLHHREFDLEKLNTSRSMIAEKAYQEKNIRDYIAEEIVDSYV